MTEKKTPLKYQDTYIYIDVSNIRSACIKTLGFNIDFIKLLEYAKRKYPRLRDIRYYEGIANGDTKKQQMFSFLRRKGYTICSLERKSYNSMEIIEQEIKCPKCSNTWTAKTTKEHKIMKSNVDVYLASDMIAQSSTTSVPTRLILFSCDGDYAEAIKTALAINSNVSIAVVATPFVKDIGKNTLSTRLKQLYKEIEIPRYMLQDINNIRTQIEDTRPRK